MTACYSEMDSSAMRRAIRGRQESIALHEFDNFLAELLDFTRSDASDRLKFAKGSRLQASDNLQRAVV